MRITQTLKAFCKHPSCPLASPESCHRQTVEMKPKWSEKNTTNYAAERQQICSSYHNSVCTDDDVWSLQVLLKQINANTYHSGGILHAVYDHTAGSSTHRGHPLSHLQGLLLGGLHGVLVWRFELAFVESFFEPGWHHLKS